MCQVAIIGAGVGGMCLAQILKKNGISVTVYERNQRSTHVGHGYWIEINNEGIGALRDCLTSQHFELLMKTTRPTNRSDCRWLPRAALQGSLLKGLHDVVQFGRTFVRYEKTSDGHTMACFADGSSHGCDVVVGADGVHSKVRQQLLPHARRVDTGVFAVGGTVALSEEALRVLPQRALEFPISVTGPSNQQLFIALWGAPERDHSNASTNSETIVADCDGDPDDPVIADHVMWRFSALSAAYGFQPGSESTIAPELKAAVLDMTAYWPPGLRRLIELTDAAAIFSLPIRTCVPVPPWRTGRVTFIGDAIHGMAPYGGLGANTAMRDASLLGRHLAAADRGEMGILDAIHDYEVEMMRYGFDAVRQSMKLLQALNQITLPPFS